jgi:hypothetical protein
LQDSTPVHDISNQVAVHHIPAAHDCGPEQSMWQVTSNPPQLIELLQDLFPEQVSTVLIAPMLGFPQESSPLQVTVHSSPSQYGPAAQLFVPPQMICVLGDPLWTFNGHESAPLHSTLQLSPPQLM